jgi:membrane protease YdiL (CAAX protease family)
MDEPQPPQPSPPNRWIPRFQAAFEVLLLSGILSSFVAALPFYRKMRSAGFQFNDVYIVCSYILLESFITILLLTWILRAHNQTFGSVGLGQYRWKPDVIIGIGIVPVLFVISGLMSVFFQYCLPTHFTNHNPLLEIIHTRRELLFFVVSALIAGGVKEELQRAFILTRFRDHLGGARFGLVLWSMAFGIAHYVQGLQGMITAGLFGFLFGAVYLGRRSLTAPMIAHGLYDALALMGYWTFRGTVGQ